LASRILWRVAHGRYRNEDELYALAHGVDWLQHFRVDRTLRVDVAATHSPIQSLEFATLKIKDAVCDRFREVSGKRPSVDKRRPDVRVHAFLTEREATFYLDTSAKRCSSAVTGAKPTSRRCAKTWRRALSRCPAGHRARRCSTRCAVAAPFSSRQR
jgi:hypothetical protein